MKSSGPIEIWNLSQNSVFRKLGSQKIFNILGQINCPKNQIKSLYYIFNGNKRMPITMGPDGARLVGEGNFNIDTILVSELKPENTIEIHVELIDGSILKERRSFAIKLEPLCDELDLDFSNISSLADIGQIVDGHWKLGSDKSLERSLQIRQADAGLDRIIVFGDPGIDTNFEVISKIAIDAWVGNPHGVGILFHWQDHKQGSGKHLPHEWNTSLAWYYTLSWGLQIKYGIDGELFQLATKHYTRNGFMKGSLAKWLQRLARGRNLSSDLHFGSPYFFKLRVEGDRYFFKLWEANKEEPDWLIVAKDNTGRRGPVGINAHRAAVRVLSFQLRRI